MKSKLYFKKSTIVFLILLSVLLVSANFAMIQTELSFFLIAITILLLLLIAFLDGRKLTSIRWFLKTLRIGAALCLLMVSLSVHETGFSTGGEVSALQMSYSHSTAITIGHRKFMLTEADNMAGHTKTYFFNLYERQPFFFHRVNPTFCFVQSTNKTPERSPLWVFKNVVLRNHHVVFGPDTEYINDSPDVKTFSSEQINFQKIVGEWH
ncbi:MULTISPECIES: hypothetical protein [Lacticaseibacillus]|uniref:Uncharacterized protein n=2 Tax=Lacticaseibacillus TaxID=2759736 RepID=A0AAN1C5R2_LACCA|nr:MULTISPECIES: hypothetical protein [Lacticaseibacillus]ARY90304.1 hypothetical protein BGL52_00440 [Lacticaseibacillus casei]KAB1969952.1 hypothetical protein F9B82_06225 [Lacticaseibacillus casei]WLV80919.1 hypothetical protein LACSTY_000086 [Lacticaseibacillus sp. NCIMB 15473]WNX24879.1 hypothetical protein RWA15_00430 [Lacticaseibacillus casei]WNX27651.1 hypothetical protein RWA16_00430 [Lacticaseibacillus casei]